MIGTQTARARGAVVGVVILASLIALIDALHTAPVLIGLLVVPAFLPAFFLGRRGTVSVGLYCIGLAIVLGVPHHFLFSEDHVVRLIVVASAVVLAYFAAGLRADREEVARRMAKVAEVAQRAILRTPPPRLGAVALSAQYLSASEFALVGGDLYETAYTRDGVRLIIGDVKGKGLDAVELAAVVLATFRQTVFGYDDLAEVARALDDQVGTAATDEDFVTALLVDIPDEGPARIANCGHHPPLLMRSGRATYVQTDAAVPLGLGAAPHVHSFEFHPGDRMLLYTDGLLEARSADGSFFPFESHAVGTLSQGQLNVALSDLVAHVLVHVDGRLNDDLAVMIVERLGTAQAAAVS